MYIRNLAKCVDSCCLCGTTVFLNENYIILIMSKYRKYAFQVSRCGRFLCTSSKKLKTLDNFQKSRPIWRIRWPAIAHQSITTKRNRTRRVLRLWTWKTNRENKLTLLFMLETVLKLTFHLYRMAAFPFDNRLSVTKISLRSECWSTDYRRTSKSPKAALQTTSYR